MFPPKRVKLKLLVCSALGHEDVVKELYGDHGFSYEGDSGLDLFCLEDLVLPPRAYSVKIPLGVCMEAFYPQEQSYHNTRTGQSGGCVVRVPTSFYLYPRSSTGSKTPIRLSNSVGVIDSSYRGQLMAIVDNVSDEAFTLKKGERYFQVCAPDLGPISFEFVDSLSETKRGVGGLGSTGR